MIKKYLLVAHTTTECLIINGTVQLTSVFIFIIFFYNVASSSDRCYHQFDLFFSFGEHGWKVEHEITSKIKIKNFQNKNTNKFSHWWALFIMQLLYTFPFIVQVVKFLKLFHVGTLRETYNKFQLPAAL